MTYPTSPPDQDPCLAFKWIGQPFTSCDRCGRPSTEHPYVERLKAGQGPFGDPAEAFEMVPWDVLTTRRR